MREILKTVGRRTPLRRPLQRLVKRTRQAREVREWKRNGRNGPPPHVIKQSVLRTYARTFDLRVLVETGTFQGDMVEALRSDFDSIYSVELSETLYQRAKDRFRSYRHVEIIHGDSGIVLESLVPRLNQPALFWLDGHYSGGDTAKAACDSPIEQELGHILGDTDRDHVIVIDDARLFGTDPHYPSIEDLHRLVRSYRDAVEFTVQDDSIRIVPRGRT